MSNAIVSSRRGFLQRLAPLGCLAGCGCARLLAMAQVKDAATPERHKFKDRSNMSYEQVFQFAFAKNFLGIFKVLSAQMGPEKFIPMVKEATATVATYQAKAIAHRFPKNDLSSFVSLFRSDDPFWKHALTLQTVEDTENIIEFKVTECLWAKTFRDADAAEIGYAAICHSDFEASTAFNPKLKLIRTKTLMQGHDCCNHRWIMEA
jgi:hypothetical protein